MRVKKTFTKPSLTKQCFAGECNINNIMARYKRKAGVDFLSQYQGYMEGAFGDASAATDYQTALNAVMQAQEAFDALPSNIRSRFENSPSSLLSFLSDSSNRDEAQALGLLNPVAVKATETAK
ncbi:MAG: internal scaffolding protein [Microvirus sp.]|nr:MAG: internal scaffolding protein [Microvirus sp.]